MAWIKRQPKLPLTEEQRITRNARRYVITLVQRGHFLRLPCAVCGKIKVEAHHYKGYAKANALDVVWLCTLHHDHVEKGIIPLSSIEIPKNLLIRKVRTVEERFWAFVDKTSSLRGCWLWTAGANRGGYGEFYAGVRGKMMMAHRYSWELANKSTIPKGKKILHFCDTPRCVRPEHLRVGTQWQNILDMERKGRARHIGRKMI